MSSGLIDPGSLIAQLGNLQDSIRRLTVRLITPGRRLDAASGRIAAAPLTLIDEPQPRVIITHFGHFAFHQEAVLWPPAPLLNERPFTRIAAR
jgi:hypothetical protein